MKNWPVTRMRQRNKMCDIYYKFIKYLSVILNIKGGKREIRNAVIRRLT
jgi:hypothetical protein